MNRRYWISSRQKSGAPVGMVVITMGKAHQSTRLGRQEVNDASCEAGRGSVTHRFPNAHIDLGTFVPSEIRVSVSGVLRISTDRSLACPS